VRLGGGAERFGALGAIHAFAGVAGGVREAAADVTFLQDLKGG